jgi:hypothetical protein
LAWLECVVDVTCAEVVVPLRDELDPPQPATSTATTPSVAIAPGTLPIPTNFN